MDLKLRSVICAPLIGQGDTPLGTIQLSTSQLHTKFDKTDLDILVSIATQACLAIENARMHQALLDKRSIELDLDFATQVQLGFLPNVRPKLKGYAFYDYYEAAQRVGGDYFDYVNLSDGRTAIAVADVAGEGLPAALLMARLHGLVANSFSAHTRVDAALSGLNAEIATSGLGHRFITCILAVLDSEKHEITVANAGHLLPIRRDKDGRVEGMGKESSGMPLGILPDQKYQSVTFEIQPGDTWVLYTDGVTEAMHEGKLYGTQRFMDFIANGPQDVSSLVKAIVAEIDSFCKSEAHSDDMCLVCFQRRE